MCRICHSRPVDNASNMMRNHEEGGAELDTWSDSITEYGRAMKAANRAPKTIRLHRHYLWTLARAYPAPWEVTVNCLRNELTAHEWGPSAMKSARTVWRGFYKWAHGIGLTDEWIAEGLEPVHVPAGLPRPAPDTVVASAKRQDERVRFMAMLGAHAGLRAGEIALVHARDLRDDLLTVHGKGRRERVVPIANEELLRMLQRVEGWAFPNPRTGKSLTAGTVSRLLSDAMPGGWTAHTLRHRYATSAYDGTGDLLAVAELLGHTSVQTTQVYVRVSANKLRAAALSAA